MELYPFQAEAVTKLSKVSAALLADDMGLGKTVQGIVIDKEKRRDLKDFKGKPLTLVVAPLSVLDVWAKHFQKWQPGLKVKVLDPKNRLSFTMAFQKGLHDVYICHWESLRLMTKELTKIWWFHVIADEVHRAKNSKAQQTVALKKIPTAHKLGLSGTPADNKPQDLWSILNWLYPRYWTSYWAFYNKHVVYVKHTADGTPCLAVTQNGICMKAHNQSYREVTGCAEVEDLHRQMERYYVRRLKEEVLKDLPEKYYSQIFVDLTPRQRRAYDQMRQEMLAWVGKHEDEPIAAPIVVAQLMRLQQFAVAYGELVQVKRRKKDPNAPNGYRIVDVWTLRLTEPSAKLDAAMALIEDNPDEQIVVFGQSKQAINMLAARLESRHIPTGMVTGDVVKADRDAMIDAFQDGKLRILLGTIAAGGVGITLTAASTVVFLDRVWSPSVNRQAEDRLHRIGQKNAVQVIDLMARNTLDLGRKQQIDLKWSWIKQILGDKVDNEEEENDG